MASPAGEAYKSHSHASGSAFGESWSRRVRSGSVPSDCIREGRAAHLRELDREQVAFNALRSAPASPPPGRSISMPIACHRSFVCVLNAREGRSAYAQRTCSSADGGSHRGGGGEATSCSSSARLAARSASLRHARVLEAGDAAHTSSVATLNAAPLTPDAMTPRWRKASLSFSGVMASSVGGKCRYLYRREVQHVALALQPPARIRRREIRRKVSRQPRAAQTGQHTLLFRHSCTSIFTFQTTCAWVP